MCSPTGVASSSAHVSAPPVTPWSPFRTVLAELAANETRGIGSQRVPFIDYRAAVGAGR